VRNVFIKAIALVALVLATLTPPVSAAQRPIRLATTTSTDNSGLLRQLLPPFEAQTGYRVHVIAVGTGKALRMGRDGDADVLLVHAYDDEIRFVKAGYGVNRRDVMYNDFIIVGPESDSAKIQGLKDALSALTKIQQAKGPFVSRGDESGTHKRERWLWQQAGIVPSGSWYREAGQGMGKVLQMAEELDGYTLTDRGTWLAHKATLPHLKLLVAGDERLYNRYGILAVNPKRYADINFQGAMRLIEWVTSRQGQNIVKNFKINNETLFFPLAATH
jgi:tungstate transport system substrate-binding protein